MPSGINARKRWEQRALGHMGQSAILTRPTSGAVYDNYGEIISGTIASGVIRIVMHSNSFVNMQGPIGALNDEAKSWILFYIKATQDVRIGDEIDWPYGSAQKWIVNAVLPEQFDNVVIYQLVKAVRDSTQ